jgi:anti-sigma factor RsiW
MQCNEAEARFSAYIDGELEAGFNEDLTAHLCQCLHCREVFDELEAFDAKLRRLPQVQLGPEFSRRMVTLVNRRPGPPECQPAAVGSSGLLDSLVDLFGLTRRAGDNPLDEFGDFPPLTIGSAYFSIFGYSGD